MNNEIKSNKIMTRRKFFTENYGHCGGWKTVWGGCKGGKMGLKEGKEWKSQ